MLLLLMGLGIEYICTVFGWVYKKLKLRSVTAEDGRVVVIIGYQTGISQFDYQGWSVLDPRFIIFNIISMFSSSGGMKFVIQVPGSDSAYCFG